MEISPDNIIYWSRGPVSLNATILFTWLVMMLMTLGSWLVTRRLTTDVRIPPWQNLLESIVAVMKKQLDDVSRNKPKGVFPFVGTLFLFIAVSNLPVGGPRLQAAHGVPVHRGRPGGLRVFGGARLRRVTGGVWSLFSELPAAHAPDAAV